MLKRSSLRGLRVVVTRPEAQSGSLMEALRENEVVPISFPVIRIEPIREIPGFERALHQLDHYDWLVFTSANGVKCFWDWLDQLNLSFALPPKLAVAAIGPSTAEGLRKRGASPSYVPDEFVGEALGEGLPIVGGARVLLPRAAGSRAALPQALAARGVKVDEFAIYHAVRAEVEADALAELGAGVDAVTFTSPSTVQHFVGILGNSGLDPLNLPKSPLVACIGPITARAARQAGYRVGVVAETYSAVGLVAGLVEFFQEREIT